MPSTVTWNNTGTVWTTAANWSGGAPVATDTALIIDGQADIDGIDQASVNLAKLAIGGAYLGRVGSPGQYLVISADEISIQTGAGGSDIYLDSGGTDAHDSIRVNSLASASHQTIYLKATTTCPELTIISGHVVLVSGTFTTVYIANDGVGPPPTVTIADATVTTLFGEQSYSGRTTGNATVTTLHHSAGTFLADKSATITNIYLRGGNIIDQSIADTTLVQQSGASIFDASENLQGKTYTTYRKIGGQCVANVNNGLGTIDVTNPEYLSGPPVLEYYA